jgi:hypothetical protein
MSVRDNILAIFQKILPSPNNALKSMMYEYNHNTMNSHDARYRRTASILCVVAASLCSNRVHAFGVAPTTSSSKPKPSTSALDIATAIPHPLSSCESLVDRWFHGELAVLPTEFQAPAPTIVVPKLKKQQSGEQPSVLMLDAEEVQRRKREWVGRYASVDALRETFGRNENKLWGDMQASTARRLYKTLLPRSLLELSKLGVGQLQPRELAPLAYQARVAAKLYSRERCTVPARIAATLFDGFRQWIKYGKFQAHGMTYDQLWEKYSEKICEESESAEEHVCLKILERSCVSNEGVDKLVLRNKSNRQPREEDAQQRLLESIHAQLEKDMHQLLLPKNVVVNDTTATNRPSKRPWSRRNHVLMVRLLARQRRLQERRLHAQQEMDEADVLKP